MNSTTVDSPSDMAQFYRDDYKLKVDFLSGQFQRMWTRFNLFLTLEVGLLAFLFSKSSGELVSFARYVFLVELIISTIWFVVGVQDRCLVLLYREQIREAADELKQLGLARSGYQFVGDTPTELRVRMLDRPTARKLMRVEIKSYRCALACTRHSESMIEVQGTGRRGVRR